ncbi:MAG: rRNA maturation RNase YbeY [Elusimicrobia bacterium]|nr:rRNA maturation RNase YbeY [Elusimicrobiota bacterium]
MRKPATPGGPVVRVAGLSLLPKEARRPRLIAAVCRQALKQKPQGKGPRVEGEINIVFLAGRAMRGLNRRFLKLERDTDVLAFNHGAAVPGTPPGETPFGDIYISAAKVRSQAADLGHSPLKETLTLVSHGSLHLLGYDDATPRQKAVMTRLEDRILSSLE